MKCIGIIGKFVSVILAVMFVFCSCYQKNTQSSDHKASSTSSTAQTKSAVAINDLVWDFGEKGQDGTKQGSNNWYYMYSEETNKNGAYDISQIKECWYSEKDSSWMPGVNKDTDQSNSINGWKQSMMYWHGNLSPALSKGPYFSAVLAFKAPSDGAYNLEISFTAGNNNPSDSGGDGVTVSVYGNSSKLYTQPI